jgi:hypothetical protein
MSASSSGTISTANTSTTKCFFNPSTGTFTATVVSSNSDERLKTNWREVQPDFVSKLVKVKSGIFDRTDVISTQPGVSAQSLQEILPEAVITNSADGYLTVNYGGAALVAAVEIAKVIEELRLEIKELKAQIAELKVR